MTGKTHPSFDPDIISFLRDLARHNDRAWFEANRTRYDASVRAPLAAFVEEMDVRLATLAPEIVGHPKRSLFRIHRDVRFSNDKRPYNTHAACWFYHDGSRGTTAATGTAHGGAGFYLHIEPGRVLVGGGIWMPPPATLNRLRAAIDEDHEALREILEASNIRRRFGALQPTAVLTRMPRGFADTHPAADLLRHKSFTLGIELPEAELYRADLPARLARQVAPLVPFVRWLNGALGLRPLARR